VKNTEHEGIGFLVVAQVLDHRGMQHGRHRILGEPVEQLEIHRFDHGCQARTLGDQEL